MKDGHISNQTTCRPEYTATAMAVVLGLLTAFPHPAGALLSESTGQIYGRAPTVDGELSFELINPDDGSHITSGSVIPAATVPSKFTTAENIAILPGTITDLDGDCDNTPVTTPCEYRYDGGLLTWVWKYNGQPLPDSDLENSLTQYTGSTLTIEGQFPWVEVKSPSGLPHVSHSPMSASISVQVGLPVITYFYPGLMGTKIRSTLPITGFIGAEYSILLDGSEDMQGYTWTTDKSWVSITADRTVKFIAQPPDGDGTYTIIGTHNGHGSSITITNTISKWYEATTGAYRITKLSTACALEGKGATPRYAFSFATHNWDGSPHASSTVGTLATEWGIIATYNGVGLPIDTLLLTGDFTANAYLERDNRRLIFETTGNRADATAKSSPELIYTSDTRDWQALCEISVE